jgi:hypothetical protein
MLQKPSPKPSNNIIEQSSSYTYYPLQFVIENTNCLNPALLCPFSVLPFMLLLAVKTTRHGKYITGPPGLIADRYSAGF